MYACRVEVLAAALACAACGPKPDFRCEGAAVCVLDGEQGMCELVGYCSYDDESCPSGRRFGRYAGAGLAGRCVEPTGASTSVASTTATTSTLTSTSTFTSTSTSTSTFTSTSTGDPVPADWWDPAWRSRIRLTIDGDELTEDAPDFVVCVILDPDRIDYTRVSSDGADLRFIDPSSDEPRAYEIDTWDAGGTSPVWVRLPALPVGGTVDLDLYYANPSAAAPPAADVWSDYVGVWHLSGSFGDSSPSGLDGVGTALPIEDGRVGGAMRFDGALTVVDVPSAPNVVDIFATGGTVEAWFRMDPPDDGDQLVNKESGPFGTEGWTLKVFQDTRFELRRDFGGPQGQWASQSSSLANSWHHVAAAFDDRDPDAGATLYFDGQAVGVEVVEPPGPMPLSDVGHPIRFGNDSLNNRPLTGDLDEVRLSATARPPGFMAAQFESMNGRLVEFGAVEDLP